MGDKNSKRCICAAGCCGDMGNLGVEKRKITIDFLYLDLSVCERCQGTDATLDEALAEVSKVLEATGAEVVLNKVNVNSEELAVEYRFLSSPTIRVNGNDIQMEIKESDCRSCGELCGESVDCRVWVYQGKEYAVPPKGLIIEAILKEVYGGDRDYEAYENEYVMPENLKRFYGNKRGAL